MKIQVPDLITSRRRDVYLVGGCVRDLIQGLAPRDFDIAVAGDPRGLAEETARRLGGRVFVLGKGKFTVFCVATHKAQIDIISYKGSNIKDDLLNRDFTINALACRLTDGCVVDVAGGLEDLNQGIVRMISPRAFQEDPVRLVRAFRMASALNFRIEAETIETIRIQAGLLQHCAAERIWAELQRILARHESYSHLLMMYNTKVLPTILPELVEAAHAAGGKGADGPGHTPLEAIQSLEAVLERPDAFLSPGPAEFVKSLDEESRVLLKMAAMLQDTGKPQCRAVNTAGRIRHNGHAARGAKLAHAIGRRLKMSKRHREWITALVLRHQRPLFLDRAGRGRKGPPPKAIGRFFRQCGEQAPLLLLLSLAGSLAGLQPAARREFLIDMLTHYADIIVRRRPSAILNGQDLIRHFNLPPSPLFGTLLRRAEELYLAGMLLDRNQALGWVAEELKQIKKHPLPGGRG
jgi:tRNA nucleotidyltransferase/poly(A) polymerase